MHPLVAEYYERWVAPDGGGKLDLDDERDGFKPESPRITKNENSQLFYVMALYQMERAGIMPDRANLDFFRMLKLSEVPKHPGLYYRRYMDQGIRQSHDNIVAIAAGAALFKSHHAKLIAGYGHMFGWCYNVQEPLVWDIRTCLQGGDIAFIKLCAGYIPTVWEMIWLAIGRAITGNDAGKINLSELRASAIKKLDSFPLKIIWDIGDLIFRIRFGKDTQWAIRQYFYREGKKEQNPIIEISEMPVN